MLLRRYSGKRLEPVCIMGRPFLDRPLLHLVCDHIGCSKAQFLAFFDRLLQILINLLGQTFLHNLIVEYIFPKYLSYI